MEQIAHFEIKETLGFGALGTVYLAWDSKLNRNVALKVLSNDVTDSNLKERFHLEARTIAALKHPNIVSVLDYSDADAGIQFIALERLLGQSVFELTSEHGPMPEQIALCVGHEVASALEYAHSQNVVHRDIKPDNVVLEGERVVLIDFGAMRLTESHAWIPDTNVDKTPMAVGTPGFMAPEQLTMAEVDHRADIFSLGALLYNACTLKLPYQRVSASPKELYAEARKGNYRDPRDYQPLLTPGFCDLLADCMAVQPSKRLESALRAKERIQALLSAHGIADVRTVLKQYAEAPALDAQFNLRSVDTLTRELKLALMRDLQRAVRSQDDRQIKDATNRLRYVHHLFDDAEKFFLVEGAEKPRLLKGRMVHRHRWFLFGLSVGCTALAALALARPSWMMTLAVLLRQLGARILGHG